MSKPPPPARFGDLSDVPVSGFGPHNLWSWAGVFFMLMEGSGFALGCAAYVYLMNANTQWPLGNLAPDLFWGTAQTVLLVGSLYPTWLLSRAAHRLDKPAVRRLAVIVALLNAGALVIRAFEFPHLNTRWDLDAYGSITWALMLLHTVHLVTDFVDTGFLTIFLFTHPADTSRLADTDDDCIYWAFVVACWIPIYLLVYWAPRWMA